jgi:Holliday junction resolvasome RuvABC ATP-dependent DNA helicase subunit
MSKPTAIFIDPNDNNDNNNDLIDYSFIASDDIFKDPYYNDDSIEIEIRAGKFFGDIITHDPIKIMLFRALLRSNRNINILLVGVPANGKTLFMKAIFKGCNKVIFYDASSGSTGAGLIELLRRNQDANILIIDEVSELNKDYIDVMRGLLNDGTVNKVLKSGIINFKMNNLKVFATTNNPTKLSLPIKSRFQMYHIPAYTDKEFIDVMKHCLISQKIISDPKLADQLANAMIFYNIKNIRVALSVCSLIHDGDNTKDIKYIIEHFLKYDASKLNVNYNEQVS